MIRPLKGSDFQNAFRKQEEERTDVDQEEEAERQGEEEGELERAAGNGATRPGAVLALRRRGLIVIAGEPQATVHGELRGEGAPRGADSPGSDGSFSPVTAPIRRR